MGLFLELRKLKSWKAANLKGTLRRFDSPYSILIEANHAQLLSITCMDIEILLFLCLPFLDIAVKYRADN